MKKFIFVGLLAISLVLTGCNLGCHGHHDKGGGNGGGGNGGGGDDPAGGDSVTYELQADGSWKDTKDGSTLSGTDGAYIAELDKAPEAGGQPSNVTGISNNYEYTNTTGTAKMVIIRTAGGNLSINAPLDTVLHYGEAGTVNVIAVASSSYDGYAAITQKLVAKAGHIKLFDLIAAVIPLIEVPADATGSVAVDIPENVMVEAVAVASAKATSLKIEGSVSTITNTGTATPTVEVAGTGIVDQVTGDTDVTVTGDGYVANDNGVEKGEAPDGIEGDTYKVYTAKGLKTVASEVNAGTLSVNKVQLQRDILLSGAWTPIGVADHPFSGTFDGQGHKIAGIAISNSTADYVGGLFGVISGTSEFKDATLDVSIEATGSGALVGGLYGKPDASCTSVTVSGVTVGGSVTGTKYAAGVVAQHRNGNLTFTDVTNNAAVSGQYAAGILGGSGDAVTSLSFINCKNTANITATKWAGAICSNHNRFNSTSISTSSFFTISGCTNSGTLSGPETAMVYQEQNAEFPDSSAYQDEHATVEFLAKRLSNAYYNNITESGSFNAAMKKVTFNRTANFDGKANTKETVTLEWFPAGSSEATMAANYACYFKVGNSYICVDSLVGAEMTSLSDGNSQTLYLLKNNTENVADMLGAYEYYTAWRNTDLVVTLHKNGHTYSGDEFTAYAVKVFAVTD